VSSWHSFPKVWSIGHGAVNELFFDPVIVEEKVDGSQFSFGVFNGELKIRSKGQEMVLDAPEKMFQKAVDTVLSLKDRLVDGWTYRCEYLQKPKHNVLAYDRVPEKHLILFDINTGEETYMSRADKEAEAKRLGLELVPLLFEGKIFSAVDLERLLDTVSILGGQKIEGFVVKNYARFGRDKKALMGKFVSENFKEKHKVDWKTENPGQNDIVEKMINTYRTPARWDKAIQHLREAGKLEGSPRDIGKIVKEVPADLLSECGDEIKEALFQWAYPQIMRGVNRGLAEYYKEQLMKNQQFAPATEKKEEEVA
jgi:hypothetical protein